MAVSLRYSISLGPIPIKNAAAPGGGASYPPLQHPEQTRAARAVCQKPRVCRTYASSAHACPERLSPPQLHRVDRFGSMRAAVLCGRSTRAGRELPLETGLQMWR
ncbi:hypothetical protein MPTK1_5g09550 [Marchantia polymorpha subsp. ruderalis]|uniref:Uncharacterized protein n=2 Tax=Marchantia polymorpha TaxID=3197 RepID=A0AAF6BGM3_MARPO|nr:hypothetical protein MARPO_0095s0005 [Marchantia polymorpha]BBN11157.1 hypothetical protein Mp_5g09550 [Marchantia polymorpha subsp. ruderalis]|eukprot:PTQ32741.1 hypothetical protein MARPO_0095s0005 [Marchantia polymorpha]